MSTTVELVRANERYARLRAAVEGLADELRLEAADSLESMSIIGTGEASGLGMAEMRLRALLAAVDS